MVPAPAPTALPTPGTLAAPAAATAATAGTTKAPTTTIKKSTGTKSSAKTVTKATGAGTKAKKTVRKKKTVKAGSAPGSSQLYAASRAAQMDLASQRNAAAARRADPLWYQLEDYVLPSVADESSMAEGAAKILPEQAQVVEAALDKNGLTRADVTPQAFACLLEQARRYAIDILSDSQDYAFVANRTEISKADLALANEFRPDHPTSITTQLPKLNLLAQTINRVPLPPIPTHCYSGVVLPSKRYQLTARTFDVVTSAQTAQRMIQAVPALPAKSRSSGSSSSKKGSSSSSSKKSTKKAPSYGASRGRQIAIHLKGDATKEKKDAVMKKD